MSMDMNIQKYMSFVKTVECGSFSKAAELLSYSQSSVSRMISDLENDWKLTLLERTVGGVKLTSDGMKILPFVKSVVTEYEKLQMEVDELNGLQSGLIRIGTFSSVATHWLPNIIKVFQRDYPNIDYELLLGDYTEIEDWILSGRVDCGFLRLPVHRDLETIFLENDRLLAVLPETHPYANAPSVPLSALCEEPFMLLEKGSKAEISELFEKVGLTPNVRFITWDDYAVMSMVESGLGISILPELILKRVPYRIVAKELDVPAYRQFCFALKSKKTASAAVRRFLDYIDYRHSSDSLRSAQQ